MNQMTVNYCHRKANYEVWLLSCSYSCFEKTLAKFLPNCSNIYFNLFGITYAKNHLWQHALERNRKKLHDKLAEQEKEREKQERGRESEATLLKSTIDSFYRTILQTRTSNIIICTSSAIYCLVDRRIHPKQAQTRAVEEDNADESDLQSVRIDDVLGNGTAAVKRNLRTSMATLSWREEYYWQKMFIR